MERARAVFPLPRGGAPRDPAAPDWRRRAAPEALGSAFFSSLSPMQPDPGRLLPPGRGVGPTGRKGSSCAASPPECDRVMAEWGRAGEAMGARGAWAFEGQAKFSRELSLWALPGRVRLSTLFGLLRSWAAPKWVSLCAGRPTDVPFAGLALNPPLLADHHRSVPGVPTLLHRSLSITHRIARRSRSLRSESTAAHNHVQS